MLSLPVVDDRLFVGDVLQGGGGDVLYAIMSRVQKAREKSEGQHNELMQSPAIEQISFEGLCDT